MTVLCQNHGFTELALAGCYRPGDRVLQVGMRCFWDAEVSRAC